MSAVPIISNRRSSLYKQTTSIVAQESRMAELEATVSIRLFVKKTQLYNPLEQPLECGLNESSETEKSPLECLMYLGLAPKGTKIHDRHEPEQEKQTHHEFLKPQIYECGYCTKFFFHKLLLRKHIRRHTKNIYRCMNSSRGFNAKRLLKKRKKKKKQEPIYRR